MPARNGMGPSGQGPRTGRGGGRCGDAMLPAGMNGPVGEDRGGWGAPWAGCGGGRRRRRGGRGREGLGASQDFASGGGRWRRGAMEQPASGGSGLAELEVRMLGLSRELQRLESRLREAVNLSTGAKGEKSA